jgi:hypothetical protein
VALLGSLLAIERRERDDVLGAIALGLASHCTIERALHPLSNARARLHRRRQEPRCLASRGRKVTVNLFHEQCLGRDTIGTPGISG